MAGVPGRGGPIPKPAAQRAGHRTKAELAGTTNGPVTIKGFEVEPGELVFTPKTRIVVELWQSAQDSVMAQYREPTDWYDLQLVLMQIDRYVESIADGKMPSAMMMAETQKALGRHLFTEADRRRLRIEIDRTPEDAGVDRVVTQMSDYQERAFG